MIRENLDLIAINSFLLLYLILHDYLSPANPVLGTITLLFFSGYSLSKLLLRGRRTVFLYKLSLVISTSMVLTILVGLALNISSLRITPRNTLAMLTLISLTSSIGCVRICNRIPSENSLRSERRLSRIVAILIIVIMIPSMIILSPYIRPVVGGRFTEFYILDSNGRIYNYPVLIFSDENITIRIGIKNREGMPMNYTIDVWAVRLIYGEKNLTISENETYHLDRINVVLQPAGEDEIGKWTPQWEKKVSYRIEKGGRWLLVFILYKGNPPPVEENGSVNLPEEDKLLGTHGEGWLSVKLWVTVVTPLFGD